MYSKALINAVEDFEGMKNFEELADSPSKRSKQLPSGCINARLG